MKYIIITFLTFFPFAVQAQTSKEKLPKDSLQYYDKELADLRNAAYDSLTNSKRYKELTQLLDRQRKVVRVEFLANLGFYFTDFTNLNARLQSIGQKEIKNTVPSLGVTLAIGFPVMIYGLDMSTYTLGNYTASFKGIHGRFFIGTHILKKSPVVLNPQLGYASDALNMYVERSVASSNFNDLFTTQSNAVQLSHTNSYLDFTLGLKLKSPKKENFYWQFLRAGYRYGLKETSWSKREGNFVDAPKDRNNQFFVQFCLGFDRD